MQGLQNFLGRAAKRMRREIVDIISSRARFDLITMSRIESTPIERLGSPYGGWKIPSRLLSPDSVVYCVGAGEDITFDLEIIKRFGSQVYTIDPTPRAKAHVAATAPSDSRFHFLEVGLWDQDETLRFYAPADPAHVSHSALNLQRTSQFFEAPARRLSTIMQSHGHTSITLLKVDIEGAEYRVLDSMLADRVQVDCVCVEYDEALLPIDDRYLFRIRRSAYALLSNGYALVATEPQCKLTFVRRDLLEGLAQPSHTQGRI